jgi:hypothetical protein
LDRYANSARNPNSKPVSCPVTNISRVKDEQIIIELQTKMHKLLILKYLLNQPMNATMPTRFSNITRLKNSTSFFKSSTLKPNNRNEDIGPDLKSPPLEA